MLELQYFLIKISILQIYPYNVICLISEGCIHFVHHNAVFEGKKLKITWIK